MGRFVRIVGPHHREPQQHAGPEAREKAWREALCINSVGPNASRLSIVLQHRRMKDECAIEFCEWFRKQTNLLTKRGIDLHIDTFDLSNNDIGDKGLASVASTLRGISPTSFRVLKLHHNRITDCTPLLDILSSGKLAELHLSHNTLNPKSIYEVVVAAASAKDEEGHHRYPRSRFHPLWLRLECNRQTAQASEKLSIDITEALSSIGRPLWRSICLVDGKNQCCPSRCYGKMSAPPAVHLTYLDFNREKCLDPKHCPRTQHFKHDGCRNRCADDECDATHQSREDALASPQNMEIFAPDAFPPLAAAAGAPRHGKQRRWPKLPKAESQQQVAEQPPVQLSCEDTAPAADTDPIRNAACKLATMDYEAEAFGYLSAAFGDPIFVHSDEHAADVGCRYPSYVFAEHGISHEFGWFPSAAGASSESFDRS